MQGDTTTILAAGLTAFSLKIPAAHIETGLHPYDVEHPFLKEGNRQLVSSSFRRYFAPTVQSKQNLINECIAQNNIHVTGNTVVDAGRVAKVQLNDDQSTLN